MSLTEREQLAARLRVARGDEPADLVLTGGKVVNVFSGAVQEIDVAMHDGIVAGLGNYKGKKQISLNGAYLAPGFIEGHLHVESTMLCPAQLSIAVAPHGTSLIVADPHEIANVMGLQGIRAMLKNSQGLPVTFYYNAPSCVPATQLETSGAALGPEQLAQTLSWKRILGLAEVMNFPGAVAGDTEVLEKIIAFKGRPIDGHAPLLSGADLNAYVLAGPNSDHECTNLAEAAEKLARGMWVMIRQGTAAHNLAELLPLVTPLTERRCMFVSDDRHPDDLAEKGHLDAILKLAVSSGLDPIIALRMVSLNPAHRFMLKNRGAIAPGWVADLVVLEDLKNFKVRQVYQAGHLVAEDGKVVDPTAPPFAGAATSTMKLPPLDEEALLLEATGASARIIEIVPDQVLTNEALEKTPTAGPYLCADPERDLARLIAIERHGKNGNIGQGLLRGLGLREGALASSVAHDSHNLVVAGMDSESLLTAAHRVGEIGGGLCVAVGDKVLAELPLPIAGLMSDQPLAKVVEELAALRKAVASICSHPEPFMPLSFACLPVIPKLKLTDMGLVDVDAFDFVEFFVD
jgi:adenine deaminase